MESLKGSGYDSVDGRYTILGQWNGSRAKWVETYNENNNNNNDGFTVTVRAILKQPGIMVCQFVSSRNVRGKFVLKEVNGFGQKFIASISL